MKKITQVLIAALIMVFGASLFTLSYGTEPGSDNVIYASSHDGNDNEEMNSESEDKDMNDEEEMRQGEEEMEQEDEQEHEKEDSR